MSTKIRIPPNFDHESALGAPDVCIAGVDEAGRGPLAGPVVAAAVVLDPARLPPGINDSKKLSKARREELHDLIRCMAKVGVGEASVEEIDELNILQASLLAMKRAVAALADAPSHVLVDGNRSPDFTCPSTALVGGDAVSLSIAAASIVAKVVRDRQMQELGGQFPGYGFERHAGYPTKAHFEALRTLGATPVHRKSFAPVRKILSPDS